MLIYLKSQLTWLISQALADLISLLQYFDILAALPFLRLLIALLTSSRVIGPVLISSWIASSLLNTCMITCSRQLSTF